ncbi:MAG: hypothetical protein V7629_04030 [Motiliproteus sp.]
MTAALLQWILPLPLFGVLGIVLCHRYPKMLLPLRLLDGGA